MVDQPLFAKVAGQILASLDADVVVREALAAARELTGARYAAIGVLDGSGRDFTRLLTLGTEAHGTTSADPVVVGELMRDPLASGAREAGGRRRRPVIRATILVHDQPYANVCLMDKAPGFNVEDGRTLAMIAAIAGIGIAHARAYADARDERDELARKLAVSDAIRAEYELEPVEQLGIASALEALAQRTEQRGIAVDLVLERSSGSEDPIPALASAIYRIVQEALANTAEHSGATRTVINMTEAGAAVRVSVTDNGAGFDPSAATPGSGLSRMRRRTEVLHGRFEVNSSPGGGTTVTATFPGRLRVVTTGAADNS